MAREVASQPALQQRERKEQQTHQSPMIRRMVNQCSCRAEGTALQGACMRGACLLNGRRAVSSRTLRYPMRVVAGTAEFAAAPALCAPSMAVALTPGCAQNMMNGSEASGPASLAGRDPNPIFRCSSKVQAPAAQSAAGGAGIGLGQVLGTVTGRQASPPAGCR